MDSANYINTLDALRVCHDRPSGPGFALIDLASDDRFIRRLYAAMQDQSIRWLSLFDGTRWQRDWQYGPVLIELNEAPGFAEELIDYLESKTAGMLLDSRMETDSLATHLAAVLFSAGHTDEKILRFYEPRMIRPILAALSRGQRDRWVPTGEVWSWNLGGEWRHYQSKAGDADGQETSFSITDQQLSDIPDYRLAEHANEFAKHYALQLGDKTDPVVWILDCLFDARHHGLRALSEQERWLRLAIENGRYFFTSPDFRLLINEPSMTSVDRLNSMEKISETFHATA